MATRKHALLTIAVAFMVLSLAACASTTSSPTAAPSVAPTPSPAASQAVGVCTDAAAVESALTTLKDADLKTMGKAGLTSAIETLESLVAALAASAKETAGPQVQALTTSIASLRTTLEGLSSDTSVVEKASDVQAAVAGVRTAAQALKATLTQCS